MLSTICEPIKITVVHGTIEYVRARTRTHTRTFGFGRTACLKMLLMMIYRIIQLLKRIFHFQMERTHSG